MSVRVDKIVPLESTTLEPIIWESLRFDEETFWSYVQENPMPWSVVYNSPGELLNDFKNAKGIITIPIDENPRFIEWFTELLELFL